MKVAVHLEAGQGQVVGAWGVLADLQNTEEAEAFESMMVVVVHINLEGARATNFAELLNDVVTGNVKLLVAWEELTSVESNAMRDEIIVWCLKLPVLQHIRRSVSISERVACWRETSILKKINTHIAEGFIVCPTVLSCSAHQVFNTSVSDRWSKCSKFANRVRVLPHSGILLRADVVH